MQTFTQDHIGTTARNNPFIVSISEKLSITPSVAFVPGLVPHFGSMTPREIEILELMGKGLSMKGTARELGISAGTVKWHIRNIYQKLGACSRDDALSKARQWQLIQW